MKRLLLYLLPTTIILLAFSCKKEIPVSNSLIGTWELSVDEGGWSGVHYHKPGNDTLAVFTANSYAFYNGSKLVKSGTYTTRKDSSYLYGQLKNRIIYDGLDTEQPREFFDIQNNQLTLFLDANDAGSVTYRRIK